MREEHFQEAALKVIVPRGYDGFWQIICQLHHSQGAFTIADIDGESNVNAQVIRKYVRLLVAGGIVKRAYTGGARFKATSYRLVTPLRHSTTRAPRLRADGSLIQPDAIEQLWTSIRSLKTFAIRDLIFAATTPEVKPSYALAKRYATHLATAGYLAVAQPVRGNIPQIWRLRPVMDTGPLPPCLKAVRADAMWDPNIRKFVGAAPVASEVAA